MRTNGITVREICDVISNCMDNQKWSVSHFDVRLKPLYHKEKRNRSRIVAMQILKHLTKIQHKMPMHDHRKEMAKNTMRKIRIFLRRYERVTVRKETECN